MSTGSFFIASSAQKLRVPAVVEVVVQLAQRRLLGLGQGLEQGGVGKVDPGMEPIRLVRVFEEQHLETEPGHARLRPRPLRIRFSAAAYQACRASAASNSGRNRQKPSLSRASSCAADLRRRVHRKSFSQSPRPRCRR